MSKEIALITAEEIQRKFAEDMLELPKLITEAVNGIELITIDSDEKLPIANARLSTIVSLVKHVEEKRKELKNPFIIGGKDIDGYALTLSMPLKQAKDRLSSMVLAYQKQKEAEIIIEQEEKKRQQEVLESRKRWEVNLLDRIRTQINARLYGGQFVTGAGVVNPCQPAQNLAEVTEIYMKLSQDFPMAQFTTMKTDAEKALKELQDMVLNHQKVIAQKVKDGTLNEFLGKEKNKAENDRIAGKAIAEKNIEKESETQKKSMEKEVKAATKGTRKTIDFTVVDFEKVPREFLTIDSVKVNEYVKKNKATIQDGIQKEAASFAVPGLRFYEHSSFVAK